VFGVVLPIMTVVTLPTLIRGVVVTVGPPALGVARGTVRSASRLDPACDKPRDDSRIPRGPACGRRCA